MSDLKDFKPSAPFGLADFFIYLLPGFFFVLGCVVYFGVPCTSWAQIKTSMEWVGKNAEIVTSATLVVVCFGVIYMVGHIIATISHVLVDRFTVECVIGYPYRHLLAIPNRRRDIVQPLNSIILGSTFLVLSLSGFHALCPPGSTNDFVGWARIPFGWVLVSAITMKLLFAVIKAVQAAILSNKPSRSRYALRWLRKNKFLGKTFFLARNILKALLKVMNMFLHLPVRLLMQSLHLDKPLSSSVREKVLAIQGVTNPKIEPHSDLFWIPCYKSLQNPVFNRMINNWLHLYSLNRNLFVSFFVLSIMAESNHALHLVSVPTWDGWFIVTTLLLAGVCFVRYLILYYGYYSQSVFRMLVALPIVAPQGEPTP